MTEDTFLKLVDQYVLLGGGSKLILHVFQTMDKNRHDEFIKLENAIFNGLLGSLAREVPADGEEKGA